MAAYLITAGGNWLWAGASESCMIYAVLIGAEVAVAQVRACLCPP